MDKEEVFEKIFESPLMPSWHWFGGHFSHQKHGQHHPFSDAIADAIAEVDDKIPGYATKAIRAITSLSGKEKYLKHYEQLLQELSELHIIKQIVTSDWPDLESFEHEPTPLTSKKNPEMSVKYAGGEIGIEVKAPSLHTYNINRSTNPIQLVSRFPPDDLRDLLSHFKNQVTPSKDATVKDFLKSADEKFRAS